MVASFYIDNNSSFIKFGSYDPLGVKPNTTLEMFKTVNVKNWSIEIPKPSFGGTTVSAGESDVNLLNINPAYPYLYVQTKNVERFQGLIIKAGDV